MKATYRVIKEYTSEFPDPIKMLKGETLHIEEKETEWKGWLWCIHPNGKAGWVSETFLVRDGDQGTAIQEYDATELTVQPGELLQVFNEIAGWYWCSMENGETGWVPVENLEKIHDSAE